MIAIADGEHLLQARDMYMNKIAVGPDAIGKIDINASVTENLNNIAKAKNKEVADIVAVVLDRPRHAELIKELRDAGARIKLIPKAVLIAPATSPSGINLIRAPASLNSLKNLEMLELELN